MKILLHQILLLKIEKKIHQLVEKNQYFKEKTSLSNELKVNCSISISIKYNKKRIGHNVLPFFIFYSVSFLKSNDAELIQ